MFSFVRTLERARPWRSINFRSSRRFRSTIQEINQDIHPNSTTLSLGKLPKALPHHEFYSDNDGIMEEIIKKRAELEGYPPALAKVREMMDTYKEYVVLTQLGTFYELYFEHALEFSSKLNITLAKKHIKGRSIPMAGFPLNQLDRHLKVLVQDLNCGVAIVEQFKNETGIDNEVNRFTRRVTRIITPGTLVDEVFLNQKENNYLLSVDIPQSALKREPLEDLKIGLAWSDISIGSTFTQVTTLRELLPTINQIGPSEIILDEGLLPFKLESGEWYSELVELKRYFRKYQALPTNHITIDTYLPMFEIVNESDKMKLSELHQKETAALRNLLQYIQSHLPESPLRLQVPVRRLPKSIMQIDARTSDALELHKSFKDDAKKGSLVHTIRRTVTDSGSRLLSQWVISPSTDTIEINKRQSLVTLFYKSTIFRSDVISKLSEMYDISRIVQRFVMGRGSAIELVQLARTIRGLQELQCVIGAEAQKTKQKNKILSKFLDLPSELEKLSTSILDNINEDELIESVRMEQEALEKEISPVLPDVTKTKNRAGDVIDFTTRTRWNVKEGASKKLREAHEKYNELLKEKDVMEQQLRLHLVQELKFKSVELKKGASLGYQVYAKYLSGSLQEKLKKLPEYHIVNSSKSSVWFKYHPWSVLGEAVENSINKILYEEQQVIKRLQKNVVHQSSSLRNISENLDLLDITSSFAVLAHERNLVCPKVDKSLDLDIRNGRHLVVEDGLKNSLKNFTPNDYVSSNEKSMWIISGPNMGGKSTFLRQNAIIVILAQIGSYVPAESARIGIVDKIFSRVGAADDLYNDMSTFMVEMIETSYILKGATNRSLAILDEVGRGTSGNEGLAIAFATLCHMLSVNRCRALFATHFGEELYRLLNDKNFLNDVQFKKTKVKRSENSDRLTYNHKLENGISRKSYAIEVAGVAGFPKEALEIATETLHKI